MTDMRRRWKPHRMAAQAAQFRAMGLDDLAANLEAQLKRADRCKHCGRPLFDPQSKERGIGPDCWAKGHR